MSIRSEAMSYRGELSGQLRDTLRRNGMQAQLAVENDQYKLIVQGHDSPMLEYPISAKQFRALADGGTNYANKNAYKTFNAIVGKDFDMPSSYVAAVNVNSRVAMGLHGYRETPQERFPGRQPHAFGRDFLGWTPRQQDGFHLRRINGVTMAPMVAEHTDGRLRPGELKSGSYGYYYKGQQQTQQQVDPLKAMQTVFPEVATRPRPQEPATPYKELITSNVYFTNEKWQECLASHGIVVDADKKTLTIQSTGAKQDFVYDLTDAEVKKLTSNSLKEVPLQERLDVMNNVISGDFKDKITMDMLNSKEHINITLKPEVEAGLEVKNEEGRVKNSMDNGTQIISDPLAAQQHVAPTLDPNQGYVNGQNLAALNERKGWYREGSHGREVEVGDIWVEKVPPQSKQDTETQQTKQDESAKTTYRMSAVINGETITHEISQKQYDKFMAVDDYQRQRMVSKIFPELDMKTRPEYRQSFNPLAFIGAAAAALSDGTALVADISHNVEHIKHPHGVAPSRPAPEVYQEAHGTAHIFVKPEVDTPQSIAEKAFNAGYGAGASETAMRHGR